MNKPRSENPKCKVLLVGCGVVGGRLLDLLTQAGDRYEVTVVARREKPLMERVNLAMTVASILGHFPAVQARAHDVNDIDRTSELIAQVAPQLIVNASSRQTFWEIATLPETTFRMLDEAKIGPWLPNHLAPARRLMLALRQSSLHPPVVNVAFPDAVNAALGRVGLAPLVGAGNVANAVPTLRRGAAAQLGCRPQDVEVRFIAHHYASNAIASTGSPGQAPVILRVYRDGQDLTPAIDEGALFRSFVQQFRRTRGVPGQVVAATNAFAMVQALTAREMSLLHAPGPEACVGGYPVRVGRGQVLLDLPETVQRSDAERVNEAGQRLEGIESIGADGVVRFAPAHMDIMHRVLGYRHECMHVNEVDDHADELQARYASLRAQLGLGSAS